MYGRRGRADARTFSLLAHVRLRGGQAEDMQRQAPGRNVGLRALVGQIAVDERVGDQALQIVRRLALHARGDFFAEQFEKEIGHFNGPE